MAAVADALVDGTAAVEDVGLDGAARDALKDPVKDAAPNYVAGGLAGGMAAVAEEG